MYERESIFSKPVPPLLGRPESRRCPVSFLQYYRCHWRAGQGISLGHLSHAGLWLSAWPGSPGPSKGGRSLRGCAGQVNPQVYFENSSWSPEQLLEPLSCPLFQALSCWGTRLLCAPSSLCSNSAGLYSVFSISPLLLLFMLYC